VNFFLYHAYDAGHALAGLLWPLFGKRRRIAVDNILRAGITADEREARRIAKESWCHLAGHICEALCVPAVINQDNWREHLDASEASPAAVKLMLETPDRPILIVSSHHGVWEAACNTLSFGRPMMAVAKTQKNRLVAHLMKNYHFRGPVTIIDKNHGFSPAVMQQWKDTNAAITILMDQYAHGGALVRFMGRPARTFTSAARLAIRYGAPIAVGSFVRVAPYRYRMVTGDPVVFEKGTDKAVAAQVLNDRLEAAIRRYPEQYLWVHRRWRDD